MSLNNKPQILLTNDDGIRSPGLWAAAAALSKIGFVHVAAPRDQYSGAGRSMPSTSDGTIEPRVVQETMVAVDRETSEAYRGIAGALYGLGAHLDDLEHRIGLLEEERTRADSPEDDA